MVFDELTQLNPTVTKTLFFKSKLQCAECKEIKMFNTIRAVVKEGRILLTEDVVIPDGTEVLVTPLIDEPDFWSRVSERSLSEVWDNEEDDVYAELLTK